MCTASPQESFLTLAVSGLFLFYATLEELVLCQPSGGDADLELYMFLKLRAK